MTSEQSALLDKAESSLRAARLLAAEGYYDFAVSRAYYTMFYLAQALLLGENMTFSKHSAVIAAFGRVFAKVERVPPKLHRYLIEGADSRNVGDYDVGSALEHDDAVEQITRAEEFLAIGKNMLASSTKEAEG